MAESMKLKFKTNIKCDGCVAKVAPVLDAAVGGGNWRVDLTHPDRILTLDQAPVNLNDMKAGLATAGYSAQEIAS
jgi:copper chaperone